MSSNPNTCPNDRKKLLSKDLMPADRTVTNILDKQEVYCDFKSYGCPQTVPLARLSSHLIQCGFDPNKAQDKCQQLLSEVTAAVDKIKPRVRRQEFEHMKERLTACQREMRLMASQTAAQSVYVEPNTDVMILRPFLRQLRLCFCNQLMIGLFAVILGTGVQEEGDGVGEELRRQLGTD
jgi:hypothetical protein